MILRALAVALAAALALAGVQSWRLAKAEAANAQARQEAAEQVGKARQEVDGLKLAIADANTRAAERERALQARVTEAQNEARKRESGLRAAADGARSESDGLRNDVDALRRQLAAASRDAAVERAAAIGAVLHQCAARHQGLAERCDRHVNDIRTLRDSWPR